MRIATTPLLLLILSGAQVRAQDEVWQGIIEEKVPADLAMSAQLYQLARLAELTNNDVATDRAMSWGALLSSDGRIYVEATLWEHDRQLTARDVCSFGVEPELVWRNLFSAYLPFDQLTQVARSLNGTGMLNMPSDHGEDNQGPGVTNSTTYIAAGQDGSGITIGLIDRNYGALSTTISFGAAPTDLDTLSFPAGTFTEVPGNSEHGTGCLEALFDHAPGASYVVCRIVGDAAFATAVDTLIARGVDIISTSSAGYNQGWADDSGPWCQAVNTACNSGILFFNSAGNAFREHWKGTFLDNGNGTHIWNGGTDTTNVISIPASDNVNVWLQWDAATPADEYDLFLFDNNNNLVASSMASSGFEVLSTTNTGNFPSTFRIVVRSNVASPPELELFAANQNLQHWRGESSTRAPSNATHPNSLSIGAVTHTQYGSAPGSDVIASYSSRGPTNGGTQAPDLAGPTDVTTVSNGGSFGGTSCATPNAAGAAAALWSAHPDYTADGIRQLLLRKAELFKDWGPPGTDMTYGHGGLFLKTYEPDTEYILQGSGNTTGTSDIPYSSIEQADQYAPTDSRVYFLGGTFSEPPPGTILDTPMIYRSLQENAQVE